MRANQPTHASSPHARRTLAMIAATALLAVLALLFGQRADAADTNAAKPETGKPLFAPASTDGTSPAASAASTSEAKSEQGREGSLAAGATSRGMLGEIVPTAAALVGTITVIVLARSALRRFGGLGTGRRPSGVVEILARYPVSRGQHVVLVKVGRRVLVTHQSAQGMRTLSEFVEADDVADILARCEGAARKTSEFSFDALLRQSGRAFDQVTGGATGGASSSSSPSHPMRSAQRGGLPASVRDTLPAQFQGAEVETVDLTRGTSRVGGTGQHRGGQR